MEKKDIIKLLKQEKEEQNKLQTNFEEEKHIKLLYDYYDTYLHNLLIELAEYNIITYNPKSKDCEELNKTQHIKQFVLHTIESIVGHSHINLDDISEKELQLFDYLKSQYSMTDDFYSESLLNEYYQRKSNDNLDLLETKDTEYKKEVANRICSMLIARAEVKQIKNFYKNYVFPKLKDLYKKKKIDFDITKEDEKTIKIKKNIISTLSSFIVEQKLFAHRTNIPKKDLYAFDFIHIDNDDLKKAMAIMYISQFIEIYNSKQFQKYLNTNAKGFFSIHISTEEEFRKDTTKGKIIL